VQEVVIAGHDRDYIAVLVFPRIADCRALCPELSETAPAATVLAHSAVRSRFEALLRKMAEEATGTSTRIERALLLDVPPSIDASEITDKGSINQRAVLTHRAALVEELYSDGSRRVISTRG